MTAGPDPDFPYLDENEYFSFSEPQTWDDNIVAIGGNLSPGMLLSAYEQGVFPWYNPDEPVIWQSPDPRCLIFPDNLRVSSSMKKILDKHIYEIKFDTNFEGVIKGCAEIKREHQDGTWISDDIIRSYVELHNLGWAHSAEAWHDGELAGGCYGIIMSKVFVGESMFAKKPNASKAAFLTFAQKLFKNGLAFVDCQVPTNHLLSLGGEEMSRENYLELLTALKISRKAKAVAI